MAGLYLLIYLFFREPVSKLREQLKKIQSNLKKPTKLGTIERGNEWACFHSWVTSPQFDPWHWVDVKFVDKDGV